MDVDQWLSPVLYGAITVAVIIEPVKQFRPRGPLGRALNKPRAPKILNFLPSLLSHLSSYSLPSTHIEQTSAFKLAMAEQKLSFSANAPLVSKHHQQKTSRATGRRWRTKNASLPPGGARFQDPRSDLSGKSTPRSPLLSDSSVNASTTDDSKSENSHGQVTCGSGRRTSFDEKRSEPRNPHCHSVRLPRLRLSSKVLTRFLVSHRTTSPLDLRLAPTSRPRHPACDTAAGQAASAPRWRTSGRPVFWSN